jgi:hypothetical protein
MKKTVALFFAACASVIVGCSTRQQPPGSESKTEFSSSDKSPIAPVAGLLLDQLVGKWVLTGTIAEKMTTHDVDAEWILNREYLRLHEVSRERDAKGQPEYEAIVLFSWDQKAGEYACLWLDSTGGGGLSGQGIARGKPNGDTIPFIFPTAGGTKFYNTFIFDRSAGTWKWIMDGEENGQLQPFARLILEKR